MIPRHLHPSISEAIASGLREPTAILEYAIDRCNAALHELYEGQSQASQLVREQLCQDVWAEANQQPKGQSS